MSVMARGASVLTCLITLLLPPALLSAQQQDDRWGRVALAGHTPTVEWNASSVLESARPLTSSRYGAEKAFDRDRTTAWVEGVSGPGIGVSLTLGLHNYPDALGVINGYAKDRDLFEMNCRVKRLKVRVLAGVMVEGFATELAEVFDVLPIFEERVVDLSDTMTPQKVRLPFDHDAILSRMTSFQGSKEVQGWEFPEAKEMGATAGSNLPRRFRHLVRLKIEAVYRGSKWDDTCLAELWLDYGNVSDVFVSGDGRSLVVRTAGDAAVTAYRDPESVLTLLDVSGNNEWAVVIKEAARAGSGRVSTAYALVHTPTGRDLAPGVFAGSGAFGLELLPTGFARSGGGVYLDYEDLAGGTNGRVACRLY